MQWICMFFCLDCSICSSVFCAFTFLCSIIRHSISSDGCSVSVGVFVTGVCGDWECICCIIRERADVWGHLCAWHLCTISSSSHHRTRQGLYARLLQFSGPLHFNPCHRFGCWLPFFLLSSVLHTYTPSLLPPALPITTLAISHSNTISLPLYQSFSLQFSLSLCLCVIYGTSRCARQGAGGGGLQTMFLMSVWVCWKSGASHCLGLGGKQRHTAASYQLKPFTTLKITGAELKM